MESYTHSNPKLWRIAKTVYSLSYVCFLFLSMFFISYCKPFTFFVNSNQDYMLFFELDYFPESLPEYANFGVMN